MLSIGFHKSSLVSLLKQEQYWSKDRFLWDPTQDDCSVVLARSVTNVMLDLMGPELVDDYPLGRMFTWNDLAA
jgi:hypothetical protein